jgi:hypothetical protein
MLRTMGDLIRLLIYVVFTPVLLLRLRATDYCIKSTAIGTGSFFN